jgi:exodeoxyribonuclease I
MGGFVFYDTETTGTETSFDQILQFAAIHTDSDLNELDRLEIRCRLLPHVTPAPMAMYITGVKAHQLTDPDIPSHYEMMCILRRKLLEWTPAVFIGYNSIAFDEDLLRYSFYKTLHPPYLTNTNGNARSDVMRMVQAAHLYNPGSIKIPIGTNGKPSFKLDKLAPANGFNHQNAHDAMADVEATIFLCNLILEAAPDIWSSFMRFSQKSSVIDYLTSELIFCFTEYFYGKPYSCLATNIGQNSQNTAEFYIFNLGVDPNTLLNLDEEALVARLEAQPKPIRRLRSNACPIIMPPEDAPDTATGKTLKIEELERRAEFLSSNKSLRQRLIEAFESKKVVYEPSVYVEKQLYEGFFNQSDQVLLEKFHNIEWEDRVKLINEFQDARLKKLGNQLIYIERPHLLPEKLRQECIQAHKDRILHADTEVPWLTMMAAKEELKNLITDCADIDKEFYQHHLAFIEYRINEAHLLK